MHDQRIASLDGLRALAALSVAVPHYLMLNKWHVDLCEAVSVAAVEVFFVLSGFVLAPQILFCLSEDTRSRIPIFFMRRWMRTLPPYLLALSLMGILTGHLLDAEFFRHLFFLQNLSSIDVRREFFAPAWSLSVEEWFYVVFPLYLLAMKYLRCGIGLSALLFIFIFLVAKVVAQLIGTDSFSVARRLVILRLDSICFGFLLYLGVSWLRERKPVAVGAVATLALTASTLMLVVIFRGVEDGQNGLPRLIFPYVAALFGASLITLALGCESAVRTFQPVRWIAIWGGRLSYDVYLFHAALIIVIANYAGESPGHTPGYVVALLTICVIVYWFFERPILAARPGYTAVAAPARRNGSLNRRPFALQFWETLSSSRKYGFPAIVAVVAVVCAMVAAGEQTMVVRFAYTLF